MATSDTSQDMIVFAFDRDSTVDVNPPDDGSPAVPLEWVEHLAHETEHEVWATGNQRLAEEADIPGDEAAVQGYVDRWGDPADHMEARPAPNLETQVIDDVDAPAPDLTTAVYRYQTEDIRPSRQQRIRLVGALFPDADRYVAVDNRYLGFVEGWEHYLCLELVEEIEAFADLPGA